jgi:hypothetical protein
MSDPFERRRLRVYIAGPITKGDRFENVTHAIRTGKQMVKDGLAPYIPHFDAYMTLGGDDISWNSYLEWDLEWSNLAEAIYRLDGESVGADLEVKHAEEHSIPVFYETGDLRDNGYDDLLQYARSRNLTGKRV